MMRTQHISRKQMSNPTGTSSYRLSLSFPFFLQLCPSNASIPLLWEHLLQLSPAKLQKGSQHTCLSSVIQGQIKLLPSHSQSWMNYPRKEQTSLISEITNTLEHTNDMRPWPRCGLKGDSTKALIPTPRSSNA